MESATLNGAPDGNADHKKKHEHTSNEKGHQEAEIPVGLIPVKVPPAGNLRIAVQDGIEQDETEAAGEVGEDQKEDNGDHCEQNDKPEILDQERTNLLFDAGAGVSAPVGNGVAEIELSTTAGAGKPGDESEFQAGLETERAKEHELRMLQGGIYGVNG
ncbi:MAG TPA: hypothetical protein VKW06_13720 [Candidatus Angelobacter sp.]|nr:hypothetical protein [Candidatus Angelobacter sp.]